MKAELKGDIKDSNNTFTEHKKEVVTIFQPGYWVLLSTDCLVLAAGLTGSDRFTKAV